MTPPLRRALHGLLVALIVGSVLAGSLVHAQVPAQAPAPLPPRPDPRSVARPAQTRIKVTSFKIHGAKALGGSRVASVLGTHASSWIPWGRKRYFDRAVFDADLRRIEAYYADRGYPDAKVTAFDAKLNEKQDAIDLSITVNEGEPLLVDRVELVGFDVLRPGAERRLRPRLPLKPGTPLDRAQLTATQAMASRALQDRGYPFAQVTTDEMLIEGKRAVITLNAMPGADARYGEVTVEGNKSVGDDVILRTLAFEPGDRFSLATVQLSQRRLYELGLFQLATVKLQSEQVSDGLVPVQVTVAEAKHRQIKLGAGYGSEEHLRGQAEWKHVNFFGGARTARVEGKWSALERGLRGSLKQPYVFSPKVSVTLSGQAWFTDEPAFWLETNGGRATVNYELTDRNPVNGRGARSQFSVSIIGEREDYVITTDALIDALTDQSIRNQLISLGLDPRTGQGHGFLGAIALDYQRTTVDSVLDARNGYTLLGHLERAGGFLPGDFAYKEWGVEARQYQRIGRIGVLATRGRISTLDPDGTDTLCSLPSITTAICPVPFFKRYFLGGSNSLRGWGRFEVSPLSAFGLPIGGLSLFEMSTEFRAPLFGKLSVVGFIDAGSVAAQAWDVELKELRYDVGPGLRYLTPIGPVRVDFARQLNPIPGLIVDGEPESRHWRIHFSVGQAF
ncbi:MAG TPA: BamA/TamA family outer membrane protein [Vicinamibacterales bacterium]|nr:BamA/TamA family outer membrane protein [Vicinamibacterales bacterium]